MIPSQVLGGNSLESAGPGPEQNSQTTILGDGDVAAVVAPSVPQPINALEAEKLKLAERDVLVKEGELALKVRDQESAKWRSPLVVAIFGAAIAALSNAGVTFYNARSSRILARESAENARILELIKGVDSIQVQRNLEFLIATKLVSDDELVKSIQAYYLSIVPGEGPGGSSETRLTPEYLTSFGDFMKSFNFANFNVVEYLEPGASSKDNSSPLFRKNTPPPRELWGNVAKIALVLEEFTRRHGAPIKITSGYRNPEYNSGIGGAGASLHTLGLAADFSSEKGTPKEWGEILIAMRDEGVFEGGIGIHRSFVHVDVRGNRATWGDSAPEDAISGD